MADRAELARIDRALLGLRRMWDAPAEVDHGGRVVEGSTLLVCLAIAEHDERGGPGEAGVREVAEFLGVTHSTASRLVSRAVDANMVTRDRSSSDPRRVELTLTPEGDRLVAASRDFRTSFLAVLLVDWSAQYVAALARLLDRFATQVRPPSPKRAELGGEGPPDGPVA